MVVKMKTEGRIRRLGVLAMLAFNWGCSDTSTGLDSEPQFLLDGLEEPPPAVVLPVGPVGHLFYAAINRTVTWSNCSANGLNGSFRYRVHGTAIGNYEGTFTETGTVHISDGMVTRLHAQFTIKGKSALDPDGRDYKIYGKKLLTIGLPGECLSLGQIVDPTVGANLDYWAKIVAPTGHKFLDHGTSQILMTEEGVPPTVMNTTFDESFETAVLGPLQECIDGLSRIGAAVVECPEDLDL